MEKGLLAGMEVVGKRFKANDMFIPEVLRCAKCMHGAMGILRPLLAETGVATAGTFVIGTVKGDIHDIGKNLVSTMLKGVGYDVVDLGINVAVDEFVYQVSQHNPEILAVSALLTTTMPQMGLIIDALEREGLRQGVMVIVGGAPVNEKFARDIGADGYARDAGDAVDLVARLRAKQK